MEPNLSCQQNLRKTLNVMFPENYIKLYHKPPNSTCSLLQTNSNWNLGAESDDLGATNQQLEVSTEPSSRFGVINLRENFQSSLKEHQAKPFGLCQIRRILFDQCFDEIIRQVTVGCIEQGLLLFKIRNELRMTINCFRKAYESGVKFGLNKAIEVELKLEENEQKIKHLEEFKSQVDTKCLLEKRTSETELKNKVESEEKLKDYFKREIEKREQIIEQQRSIIRALSQKSIEEIRNPLS